MWLESKSATKPYAVTRKLFCKRCCNSGLHNSLFCACILFCTGLGYPIRSWRGACSVAMLFSVQYCEGPLRLVRKHMLVLKHHARFHLTQSFFLLLVRNVCEAFR